jgi:hypothetical protein
MSTVFDLLDFPTLIALSEVNSSLKEALSDQELWEGGYTI